MIAVAGRRPGGAVAAGRRRIGVLVDALSRVAAHRHHRSPTRCRSRPSIVILAGAILALVVLARRGVAAERRRPLAARRRGAPEPRSSSSRPPTSGSWRRGASTISGRRSTRASASIGRGPRRSGCPPSPIDTVEDLNRLRPLAQAQPWPDRDALVETLRPAFRAALPRLGVRRTSCRACRSGR